MSETKILNKDAAEKFMADSSSVNLSGFTEITREAAEILSEYGKREGDRPDGQLDLSGLKEITEECAEALENHSGEINLYGLDELSREIASKLGKKSGTLILNGLKTISFDVAQELANHSDGYLSLDGLEHIDEDTAGALAKHTGGWLSLEGLSEISEAVAEKLITSSDELRLGLTKISDPVARILASFSGNLIMEKLNIENISDLAAYLLSQAGFDDGWDPPKLGLKSPILTKEIANEMVENGFPSDEVLAEFTSISDEAADIFGKSDGDIKLIGLHKISESCAEKLSKFKGNLDIKIKEPSVKAVKMLLEKLPSESTFGIGLAEISDEIADSIPQYKGKCFELSVSKMSESIASRLAKYKGSLLIDQFKKTELVFSALLNKKELVEHKNQIDLLLSDKCAEELSLFKGESLSIKGASLSDTAKIKIAKNLTSILYFQTNELSEDVAQAFKSFRGPELKIEVPNLSTACATALAEYQGKLSLINIKQLSDEAAACLGKYSGSELKINEFSSSRDFKISNAALIALAEIKNALILPSFLDVADEVIAAFVKRSQSDLNGRTVHSVVRQAENISAKNLEEIVKQHNRVDLELKEISEEMAAILSKNLGKLILSNLRKLSDGCASLLSAHKGELFLKRDIEISPQGMEILKKHKGPLHFKEYSDFLYGVI